MTHDIQTINIHCIIVKVINFARTPALQICKVLTALYIQNCPQGNAKFWIRMKSCCVLNCSVLQYTNLCVRDMKFRLSFYTSLKISDI